MPVNRRQNPKLVPRLPESGPPEALEPTKLNPPGADLLAASRPPKGARDRLPSDAPTLEAPLPAHQPPEDESTFVRAPSRELREQARPERPPRSGKDPEHEAAAPQPKVPTVNDLLPDEPFSNDFVPNEETLVKPPPPALLREIRQLRPARPEVVTLDETDLDEGWSEGDE